MSSIVLHPSHALAGYRPGAFARKRAGAALYAAVPKRYKMAIGVGAHLYRNRGRYYRAARIIGRAWRRNRGRLKNRIGKAPGTATSKRCAIVNTDVISKATRTIYEINLVQIPKTTTNAIDSRQRDIVNVRGFKLCFQIRNKRPEPLLFNMAVVYDKRSNDAAVVVNENDFFRGAGNDRGQAFSNTLTSNEFHCLPLNKDRFTILWHKRFMIGGDSDTTDIKNVTRNYRMFHKWLPLKKQIAFDDDNAQSKIWLIYWGDRFLEPASAAAASDTFDIMEYHKVYFREPRT